MIKEDKNKGKLKIWLYRDKATGEMKVKVVDSSYEAGWRA